MRKVEDLIAPGGAWKAEIWRRDDGTLRVVLLRLTEEIPSDFGHIGSFWSEVRTAASITDSIDIARTIAAKLLAAHGGG